MYLIFTGIVVGLATYWYFRNKRQIEDGRRGSNTPTDRGTPLEDGIESKSSGASSLRSGTSGLHPRRKLSRRHSTMLPQFRERVARAAKDQWKRFMLKRQYTELNRGALPKPPSEYFEPNALPQIPDDKPLFYMNNHTRLLELPETFEIKREDIEVISFDEDSFIIQPGDDDDSIYVVLDGLVAVYINIDPPEGRLFKVKHVTVGECFFSFLSIIDILMKKPSRIRTVSLKTLKPTKLAKYSFHHFLEAYKEDPTQWIRPIQIVITRLMHVTMTTLNDYLGLSEGLLKKRLDINDHPNPIHGLGFHPKKSVRVDRSKIKLRRYTSEIEGDDELLTIASNYFGNSLQLTREEAYELIKPRIRIVHLEEGQQIYQQGSVEGAALVMVVDGMLQITPDAQHPLISTSSDNGSAGSNNGKRGSRVMGYAAADDDEDEYQQHGHGSGWKAYIYHRELICSCGLQLLVNEPAIFTISAASASTVAVMERTDLEALVERKPSVVLPIAHSVLIRMSPFLRSVDFAIDWVLLDSGETVYRQGDSAESIYFVLSGRLRSVSNKAVIEEFGRGDVLGMNEVLQRKPRSTTVLAVRYSQLSRVPKGLLNYMKIQFHHLGERLLRLLGRYFPDMGLSVGLSQSGIVADSIVQKNLHTIAVLPASTKVPIAAFTCELYHALNTITQVLRLSHDKVAGVLGEACLEKQADFGLMHWLNGQEEQFSIVIYECDYAATNWTRRCLRQADAIFVVANGQEKPPDSHFIDEHLKTNQDGIRTRKELVLLWPDSTESPKDTFEWLKGSWFSCHYHVRAPDRMYQWVDKIDPGKIDNDAEVVEYYMNEIFPTRPDVCSDFSRIARLISGNAIGLALGGGGAKGASHVGVIEALRNRGIPIDIVGGTSIGSLVGGVFADDPEGDLAGPVREWFMKMTSIWRKLFDLTYWYSAMFTGAGFNRTIKDVFGNKSIEDLWLPYFCVTTDITTSEMRVHRSGPLWTYVRASMSLAGYLPPLCDPMDSHLLLDGGYVNNLPADVMRSMGARAVIAVDVGSANETDLYDYGDSLSGTWLILRRLNPFAKPLKILKMQEIQSRLAFVSCVRQLEQIKKAAYCNYLRPPIDNFQTLEFEKFDTIAEIGCTYANDILPEIILGNDAIRKVMDPEKLRQLMTPSISIIPRKVSRSLNAGSFTDMAAKLSRIPQRHSSLVNLNDLEELAAAAASDDDEEFTEEEELLGVYDSEPEYATGFSVEATTVVMNGGPVRGEEVLSVECNNYPETVLFGLGGSREQLNHPGAITPKNF